MHPVIVLWNTHAPESKNESAPKLWGGGLRCKSLGADSEDSGELVARLDEVVRARNIVHPNAARGAAGVTLSTTEYEYPSTKNNI